MALPYENATSGTAAVGEMQKIIQRFGATSFGHMEDYASGELLVQFEHHGRRVSIRANAKGYAAAWLKEHPYNHSRMRKTRADHEAEALKRGKIAVYSILRDWIKGQVTAVEIGMLTFEGAFLGNLLLPNGQTILEHLATTNVLQIEARP